MGESASNAGDARDGGSIPASGGLPGTGNGNPLQFMTGWRNMVEYIQSVGSHRVRHNWAYRQIFLSLLTRHSLTKLELFPKTARSQCKKRNSRNCLVLNSYLECPSAALWPLRSARPLPSLPTGNSGQVLTSRVSRMWKLLKPVIDLEFKREGKLEKFPTEERRNKVKSLWDFL